MSLLEQAENAFLRAMDEHEEELKKMWGNHKLNEGAIPQTGHEFAHWYTLERKRGANIFKRILQGLIDDMVLCALVKGDK